MIPIPSTIPRAQNLIVLLIILQDYNPLSATSDSKFEELSQGVPVVNYYAKPPALEKWLPKCDSPPLITLM